MVIYINTDMGQYNPAILALRPAQLGLMLAIVLWPMRAAHR